jgi:hypothetical protein
VNEKGFDFSILNYYAGMQSQVPVSHLDGLSVFFQCVDYLKDKDYARELVTDAGECIILYRAKDAIWAQFKSGKHSGKYVCVYTYNPSYIGDGHIQFTPEYPMEQRVFPPLATEKEEKA